MLRQSCVLHQRNDNLRHVPALKLSTFCSWCLRLKLGLLLIQMNITASTQRKIQLVQEPACRTSVSRSLEEMCRPLSLVFFSPSLKCTVT